MKPAYKLNDELLTIEELAGKLRVKVRTVREWIARRKIPFTRFQRRIYIHAGVVEGILRGNAVLPVSPRSTLSEQGGAAKEGDDPQ